MGRKLVSVVTGTYNRHALLVEAIRNVREQTYRPLEHVIVADGPDNQLAGLIAQNELSYRMATLDEPSERTVPIRFQELGFHSSSVFKNSRNAAPMIVAQLLARGEYLTWMADDERAQPDHIEALVDALESNGADFAYSQTEMWWAGRPERRWVIGTDPPQCTQITNVLYRRDLLERGLTRLNAGDTPDWDQIGAWVAAGATWAYVPRVTFEHRADH